MATEKAKPIEPTQPPGFGIRHLMFLVLVCAVVMSAIAAYWRFALIFLLSASPVVIVAAIVVVLLRRRSARQQTLLRVLTIAAERNVPISTAAEAFAELCSGGSIGRNPAVAGVLVSFEESPWIVRRAYGFVPRLYTGGISWKARSLGRLLQAGEPLPRVLQRIPRILPRTAIALASVGWSEQVLARGLREAEDSEEHRQLYSARLIPRIGYMIVLLFALESIGGFFMYWIMPKFQAIFDDFGVDLPGPTIAAIEVGRFLTSSGAILVATLAQVVAAIALALAFMGFLVVRPPGMNWLLRRPDGAAVLRALSITVEAGRPIGEGLALMGGYYGVESVRKRLQKARDRIDQGHPWVFALRDTGFLRPADIPILDSAEKAGNLPWALRTVASSYERRFGYALQVLAQILLPIIVLGVGSIVGLFAVGYFMPLVELIRRLGG